MADLHKMGQSMTHSHQHHAAPQVPAAATAAAIDGEQDDRFGGDGSGDDS